MIVVQPGCARRRGVPSASGLWARVSRRSAYLGSRERPDSSVRGPDWAERERGVRTPPRLQPLLGRVPALRPALRARRAVRTRTPAESGSCESKRQQSRQWDTHDSRPECSRSDVCASAREGDEPKSTSDKGIFPRDRPGRPSRMTARRFDKGGRHVDEGARRLDESLRHVDERARRLDGWWPKYATRKEWCRPPC